MKIVKSFEKSRLLIKGITETFKMEKITKKWISFNVIRNINC